MDARIAERRREVVRQAVRRRRRVAGATLALLLLAGAVVAAARSPLFAITRVRVEGVEGPQAEALREAAGVRVGENLAAVDLEAASARVEALPWVASASARREPPSTVVLDIVPRVPVAALAATGGRTWQVDESGWVVGPGPGDGLVEISADDVVVAGPGQRIDDPAVNDALRVHAALPRDLRRAVVSYTADAELEAELRLRPLGAGRGRARVRLGDARRLEDKAAVLRAVLAAPGPGVRLRGAVVDVTAPRNPVVVPAP